MEDASARRRFEERAAADPAWAERAAADADRPRYHFVPPPGWINDPIPFYARGSYHVFLQSNPGRPYWGDMHWDHAVTSDLLHWRQLPVALAPEPGGPDAGGCWTGCVVEDGGLFHALYTGVEPQVQCLATSPDLVTWRREGVVLDGRQRPPGGETFRDPCVWREGGRWQLVLGADLPSGGAPLLYTSAHLRAWEYVDRLCAGAPVCDECPDLFPAGEGQWVLLSSRDHTAWAAGPRVQGRLHPERWGLADHGCAYALKTLLDARGRRVAFGWVRETRSTAAQIAAGWSGVLSLPRVLTLRPDGGLGIEPAGELEALRAAPWTVRGARAEGPGGRRFEVWAQLQPRGACGLLLQDRLPLIYDPAAGTLDGAPMTLAAGEPLELRIFVDGSVVEVFANGRWCKTLRAYGPAPDAAAALGGELRDLRAWDLRLP